MTKQFEYDIINNMIDTHCHLSDSKYDGELNEIVDNFLSAGLDFVVTIGYDKINNQRSKEIANKYDQVYYTIGIHPDDCDEYDEAEIESYLMVNDPKLVAVGEIGLDYYHSKDNKEKQKQVFISQILLAKKYNLPIVIHCRDAYGDMLEILKEYAPFESGAVMHCYSGSLEFAREIIKLDIKISFTGSVTFKNAHNLHEVAKNIPLDSFFFETDSPYMTPEPFRGRRNEPKLVYLVAERVASLRDIDSQELIRLTDENARKFYKINQ